jgi:aldehyde decarbonylase
MEIEQCHACWLTLVCASCTLLTMLCMQYLLLAPWVAHGVYLAATKGWKAADLGYIAIFPSLLLRMLHNQVWITVSRLQNARSRRQIVDRGIEFEQVDRERNWDDQILLSGILLFLGAMYLPGGQHLPLWRTDGAVLIALLHAGPVELIYYWLHRALHHHFLYTRYHSHHHASIVTEPVTCKLQQQASRPTHFQISIRRQICCQ